MNIHKLQTNQFDVIRSYSKDKFYRSKQTQFVKSFLENFIKKQNLLKYNNEIDLISDLFYYCATTLLNRQTIGQEYFNLIYFNQKKVNALSAYDRTRLVSLKLIAPYLMNYAIRTGHIEPRLKWFIGACKIALIFAERLNRIHFLFRNSFYNLENLLTGTKIISINIIEKNGTAESLKTLKLIGFIKVLTLVIQLFNECKFLRARYFGADGTVDASPLVDLAPKTKYKQSGSSTCLLCLDCINEPTTALCGHIFCFSCIQAHVNNAKKNSSQTTCPSCRTVIEENKLICLHNF